jgi:MFS family permease
MLQNRPFYGWRLLTALAAIVSINVGMTYVAAAVVNAPMARDLEMSRGTLGLGSTVFLLCLGLSAPLVARFVNSLGSRATLCVGSLLIALGSILLASCVSRGWQFVLGYGLLLGAGCGFGGIAPAHSCATLWFEKWRAMALALVLVGAGLGGSIFAPFLTRLIAAANGNWHAGWLRTETAERSARSPTMPLHSARAYIALESIGPLERRRTLQRFGCSLWPPSANLCRVLPQSLMRYRICVTSATRLPRPALHSDYFPQPRFSVV